MIKALLVSTLFSLALRAEAPRDFAWRIPLSGELQPDAYYRIPLPREVRALAADFPRDLRIFDETGAAWPFFLERPPQTGPATETVSAVQRNALHVEGPDGHRQIDLHISGDRPVHTQLHIQTDGTDYVRRVEVLGSDDQQTWGLMAMGYLIHANRPQTLRETIIRYPASNLPYLRVRVFPNTRDALETFSLQTLRVERATRTPAPPLTEHTFTRLPDTAAERRIQHIHLDLGLVRQPFQAIELDVEGRDYLRRVNLFTRDRESDSWRGCGGGDILRVETLRQNRLNVSGTGRFIRLDIHNHNDPPLDVQSLRVLHRTEHLITQAPPNASAPNLYLGAEHLPAPRYDLQTRMDRRPAPPPVQTLHPAAPEENPLHRPGLSPGRLRMLSILLVATVSTLVIWIIYRMMTSPPNTESTP